MTAVIFVVAVIAGICVGIRNAKAAQQFTTEGKQK